MLSCSSSTSTARGSSRPDTHTHTHTHTHTNAEHTHIFLPLPHTHPDGHPHVHLQVRQRLPGQGSPNCVVRTTNPGSLAVSVLVVNSVVWGSHISHPQYTARTGRSCIGATIPHIHSTLRGLVGRVLGQQYLTSTVQCKASRWCSFLSLPVETGAFVPAMSIYPSHDVRALTMSSYP